MSNSIKVIDTPMLCYIEGNIACGKTTLMEKFQSYENVNLMIEPLNIWENFNGQNLLKLRYENRDQYEYSFQTLANLSRLDQINQTYKSNKIKFMERSLYSSFEVFVQYSRDSLGMDLMEYQLLKYAFDVSTQGALHEITKPDLIIYLRTAPLVSFNRMMGRKREAENSVTFQTIKGLHQAHETWLKNVDKLPCPVLTLNGNLGKENLDMHVEEINKKLLELFKNKKFERE